MKAIDFTDCMIGYRFYDGADKKISVEYNGKFYLLKFAKSIEKRNELNTSYANNVFSEYIGSHIFADCGIESQNTLIGTYKGKLVVACEDFNREGFHLQEFSKFENSYLGTGNAERTPRLEDVENIIRNHERLDIRDEAEERFWDTFVLDAFLGNFDRHCGNWGYLVNEDTHAMKLAPVYDCGGCLYPQLADHSLEHIMNHPEEMEKRIYQFPKAALQIGGQRVGYNEVINSMEYPGCNRALVKIVPQIEMDRIRNIINETPLISEVRKRFLMTMLQKRKECLLDKPFEKLQVKGQDSVIKKLQENKEKAGRRQTVKSRIQESERS